MEVVTSLFTAVLAFVTEMITLFIANPITLVPIVIGIVGSVAGVTGSILRGGRRRKR